MKRLWLGFFSKAVSMMPTFPQNSCMLITGWMLNTKSCSSSILFPSTTPVMKLAGFLHVYLSSKFNIKFLYILSRYDPCYLVLMQGPSDCKTHWTNLWGDYLLRFFAKIFCIMQIFIIAHACLLHAQSWTRSLVVHLSSFPRQPPTRLIVF